MYNSSREYRVSPVSPGPAQCQPRASAGPAQCPGPAQGQPRASPRPAMVRRAKQMIPGTVTTRGLTRPRRPYTPPTVTETTCLGLGHGPAHGPAPGPAFGPAHAMGKTVKRGHPVDLLLLLLLLLLYSIWIQFGFNLDSNWIQVGSTICLAKTCFFASGCNSCKQKSHLNPNSIQMQNPNGN